MPQTDMPSPENMRPSSRPDNMDLARGEPMSLGWRWPDGLWGLSITNFILRIITLGIYHFWALTETRKRIWSGVRINNEPLAYTGRGLELFLGLVIVVVAIFVPAVLLLVVVQVMFGPQSVVTGLVSAAVYIGAFILFGLAVFRAARYRLSRTRWRGIRGGAEGGGWSYAATFVWTTLLLPLTLGWLAPFRTTLLQKRMVNSLRFGDRPFVFDASSAALYPPFAVLWFGLIFLGFGPFVLASIGGAAKLDAARQQGVPYVPTLSDALPVLGAILFGLLVSAVIYAWYNAKVIRHFAVHTKFEGARFSSTVTAFGLIWVTLGNWLLSLLGFVVVSAILFSGYALIAGLPDLSLLHALPPQVQALIVMPYLAITLISYFTGSSLFGPIISARSTGYLVRNLNLTGKVPVDEIIQTQPARATDGEGLSQAFDVDIV